MRKAWLEDQLEQAMNGPCSAQTVYDAAALITVLDEMRRREGELVKTHHHEAVVAAPVSAKKHLTLSEAEAWTHGMHSGTTHGPRWSYRDIRQYAPTWGVHDEHDVIALYAVINAMWSDYHEVAAKYGVDKADFYADLAKAFLHDEDAVPGKAMIYYDCIVQHE